MKTSPLDDQTRSARRKPTGEQREVLDGEERLVGAVVRVKMGRRVVVEEHPDHDAVKPAELRHPSRPRLQGEKILRLFPSQLEINAVGTELDIFVPGNASMGRNVHSLEEGRATQGHKDTFTHVRRKVDFPFDSILVADRYPVIGECSNLRDLQHLNPF